MPIYEYRCSSCGHELEALQKLSDAPLTVCPSCNAIALTKLLSAAGFHLKGTGWYATDFKSSGKKPADKPVNDAPATGEAGAKTDSKTETKSDAAATKAESKTESKTETKTPAPTASSGSGTGS